ncbi:hypothetical protein O181_094671 [Austropuccinia psidii MF-1]|uniref:Phosphatidic acid phosphatase type 2/haloperoxidase domain-containing protein n=1 Tax=Austropuccinia psidii MF-1 TaxID=1389203 RepID=A0A9Q3J3Y5_9BASI|nr:hypothetical protein [Austropuccinia psidii MF-1]
MSNPLQHHHYHPHDNQGPQEDPGHQHQHQEDQDHQEDRYRFDKTSSSGISQSLHGDGRSSILSSIQDDPKLHRASIDGNDQIFFSGRQHHSVYQSLMSPWRSSVRSFLLFTLQREMPLLESIQSVTRTPFLDHLMIHSSWLGSHQFFILALPLFFWFGDNPQLASSQVYLLAGSVYLSGFIKDLFCIPRPYSPPIIRLSISNHANEYGFPSTHSATSIATILIGLEHALDPSRSSIQKNSLIMALTLYAFLLVFGRVYCGMHSIQDVIFGGSIGGLVWAVYRLLAQDLKLWVESGTSGWLGLPLPLIVILIGIFLIIIHPEPIDDCPCFEDSTAFVAVSVGVMIGHWAKARVMVNENSHSRFLLPHAIAKLIMGLLIIFGWRLLMKELLSRCLPHLFRLCTPLVELPRRHHTPTRDYNQYRDELREHRRRTGLQATLIPSVVHLPLTDNSQQSCLLQSSNNFTHQLHPSLRSRNPIEAHHDPLSERMAKDVKPKEPIQLPSLDGSNKRYDIDVLMRLIVYSGIGLLTSFIMPQIFNLAGLN